MEKQVDIDKQLIQSKLLKVCESCRDVEDSYKDSIERYDVQNSLVTRLEDDLRLAICKAQYVAQSVANYYERNPGQSTGKG